MKRIIIFAGIAIGAVYLAVYVISKIKGLTICSFVQNIPILSSIFCGTSSPSITSSGFAGGSEGQGTGGGGGGGF